MHTIGVDIGGTNIKAGLVDEAMCIVLQSVAPFPAHGGDAAQAVAQQIQGLMDKKELKENDLAGIGLAVPGSIDKAGQTVQKAWNLGFDHEPLIEKFQSYFPNINIRMLNDANAATLAEWKLGALRGLTTAVLLTLGTGVGGGLILDGKLFLGGNGSGTEPGHMILRLGGRPCTCGNSGCAEPYASASALLQEALAEPGFHCVDAKEVLDRAKAGDAAALRAFDRYIESLGALVASLINLLDPEAVAIGGGLSAAGDFLFDALRKNALPKVYFEQCGQIFPAALGNEAGMLGAALWVKNYKKSVE